MNELNMIMDSIDDIDELITVLTNIKEKASTFVECSNEQDYEGQWRNVRLEELAPTDMGQIFLCRRGFVYRFLEVKNGKAIVIECNDDPHNEENFKYIPAHVQVTVLEPSPFFADEMFENEV